MIAPEYYKNLSPQQAIKFQENLKQYIKISHHYKEIKFIGGADISFNKNENTVYSGIVILSYPDLKLVSESTVISETTFPYISGLLAFREIPSLLLAFKKLEFTPDIMILDGQGIAHERRTGIATHFGILTDIPSIGCTKSILRGKFEEPQNTKFAQSPIYDRQDQIGIALRSKPNCNPIYISPGHKISIRQSAEIIKICTLNYRIPEPTRLAHLLVNRVRIIAGSETNQLNLF